LHYYAISLSIIYWELKAEGLNIDTPFMRYYHFITSCIITPATWLYLLITLMPHEPASHILLLARLRHWWWHWLHYDTLILPLIIIGQLWWLFTLSMPTCHDDIILRLLINISLAITSADTQWARQRPLLFHIDDYFHYIFITFHFHIDRHYIFITLLDIVTFLDKYIASFFRHTQTLIFHWILRLFISIITYASVSQLDK